ncbi:MAG: Flp pilus assembly protein CpaB [Terracidiphilus sp.]|jgi:pilus assembly protein CpaB
MNRRLLTILLIAFFIAAVCTLLIAHLVRNQAAARQPVTTLVVAAKADIKLGNILTADNITTLGITGTPPKEAILEKDMKTVIGRGVVSDLYEGEPIIESRLAAIGSGGGLAATIPPGMRACAVKVDDVVNVSGFVTPGMRVDVLISGTPPGQQNSNQGTEARTLLQNIQVLSAGTDIQKDNQGKPKQVQVVNLLVTPEQAETLSLASNQVTIRLVLRNPLDTKVEPVPGTATVNLFGGPTSPTQAKVVKVVKHVAPQAFVVEVFNGSKQSSEKFASPGGRQ